MPKQAESHRSPANPSRRRFLGGLTATAATSLLAACAQPAAQPAPPKPTAGPEAAAPPAAGTTPTAQAAPSKPAPAPTSAPVAATGAASRGDLRIGLGIHFPGTLDANKDGFTLIFMGAAETLTRLTPDQKLEPALAASVTNVDPTTWRLQLRRGATFWDGSPVDAEAVVQSLRQNFETQAVTARYIAKETQLTAVDEQTVLVKTPRPYGDLPYSLATPYFVVHKPGGTDGGSIMTGPYRPTRFVKDQEMTMEAFGDYWGGPPQIGRINVKLVVDANARALGLQSNDLDMLWGLPPEIVKSFGPDIETMVVPSTRVHSVTFNTVRPPFSERAVREAMSLGIDRAKVNTVGLDGLGTVTTTMFPPNAGMDVVDSLATDVDRAARILDEAGWRAGPDGIRAKDGKRLAFTLFSYPGRAELTPMAVAIQSQLKPLGYDIQVQSVQDITGQIKDGDFDASMISINTLVTGDPQYMFQATLLKGGASNYEGYDNPQLEALIEQMKGEPDPARRQALSRQGQEIVKADVPRAYLVAAPTVAAFRKGKVQNYAVHPNDVYFIDHKMSLGA